MSELRRLLDGDSDELALEILRSAGDDSPPAESLKAAALALGISGTLGGSALLAAGLRSGTSSAAASGAHAIVAGAPAGAATVASITVGALVKQVAIGVAAGVFAMGGVQLVSEQVSPSTPSAARAAVSSPRVAAVHTPSHSSSPAPLPEAQSRAAEAPDAPAEVSRNTAPTPPAPRRRSVGAEPPSTVAKAAEAAPTSGVVAASTQAEPAQVAPVTEPPVALNKSLAAEVALLDRARNALLAQNPRATLRALEQYRKKRQTAILEPEANVLQIQALDKLGEHAAAVRLAREFVQRHPASRHVESLRALAAEAP